MFPLDNILRQILIALWDRVLSQYIINFTFQGLKNNVTENLF